MRPYVPLLPSGHLLTIAAHYWPRPDPPGPSEQRLFRTDPGVQVLGEIDHHASPRAFLVLLHGLEGSSEAGYMRSMASAALEAGLSAVRLNMRSCGGTEELCRTIYHAGLTADLRAVVEQLRSESDVPIFVTGYSLGGNVALKLAGELGAEGGRLLAGVCAVSPPIDLAACVSRMEEWQNRLYEARFLGKMKARMRYRHRLMPDAFPIGGLEALRSVREFDDRITAPSAGFSGAEEYYRTQSARNFLDAIQVPVLIVAAQDDPLIPFRVFEAIKPGTKLELLAPEHGGHVGFLARGKPRFWVDGAILEWIERRMRAPQADNV